MELCRESINEKLFFQLTDSGLPVYMQQKENLNTFYMFMLVNYGGSDLNFTRLDDKKNYSIIPGTAHFLEHKLFESENKDIFEKFAAQNASVNAYTNFTETVYYFSCTDYIEENIELFLHLLQNPFISDENVEKEKEIILQEIRMYEDDPNWRMYNNFLKNLYKRNNIRYEIAGTPSDLKHIDKQSLLNCYDCFYVSDNMSAFILGDVELNWVFNIINKEWKRKKGIRNIYRIHPHEPPHVKSSTVTEELNVVEKMFLMGFKELYSGLKGKLLLKREIELNILLEYLFGSISPLYEYLYDNGFIDSSFGYSLNIHSRYVFSTISGNSREPELIKTKIFEEIIKIKREGINRASFEMIKRMLIGNYIKTFDNEEMLANNMVLCINKGCNFFDILEVIKSVDIQDLLNCITDSFSPLNFTSSIIKPRKAF